jgi:hypothetical protein
MRGKPEAARQNESYPWYPRHRANERSGARCGQAYVETVAQNPLKTGRGSYMKNLVAIMSPSRQSLWCHGDVGSEDFGGAGCSMSSPIGGSRSAAFEVGVAR